MTTSLLIHRAYLGQSDLLVRRLDERLVSLHEELEELEALGGCPMVYWLHASDR